MTATPMEPPLQAQHPHPHPHPHPRPDPHPREHVAAASIPRGSSTDEHDLDQHPPRADHPQAALPRHPQSPEVDPDSDHDHHVAAVIASLREYNPAFTLTPEVRAIMRLFFDDLSPEAATTGSIPLRALFAELERLDPAHVLVSEDTRLRLWRDLAALTRDTQERLDFNTFCLAVLRWRSLRPEAVARVYTAWATQLRAVDFGHSDGDEGVFVLRAEDMDLSQRDVLRAQLTELLRGRRLQPRPEAARRKRQQEEEEEEEAAHGYSREWWGEDGAGRGLAVAVSSPRHAAAIVEDGYNKLEQREPTVAAAPSSLSRFDASSWKKSSEKKNKMMTKKKKKTEEGTSGVGGEDEAQGLKTRRLHDKEEEDEEDEAIVGAAGGKDKPAPPVTSALTVSKSFVAGGAAGIVAKSILSPVDRIKIMFQVNETRVFSFRNAFTLAREIYVQDGFRALFRGNTLNILRIVPYAGVQHSSFDFFRRQFHAYNYEQHQEQAPWADMSSASAASRRRELGKLSNAQLITAGSLAGGLSLTLSYPLDIVRARFMVQHGQHKYTSLSQAVLEMYQREGARSFTRGLLPSLMGTLPYTGIGFTLNEKFKMWMLEMQQQPRTQAEIEADAIAGRDHPARLHPFSKLVCSYFAACIAQTATYPMDTIRRRIQTDGFVSAPADSGGHTYRYTGIMTTARIIVAHEGWRGFFKGVSVNWMRSPLATSISLTTYDILKEVMGIERVP